MDRVDDVGFLRYVMQDVSSRFRIDPRRQYVVGYSNGGMLAYRFAAENSACIAAVGVVAGALGSAKGRGNAARWIEPPQMPVPLIAIHGRADETVPLAGGPGRHSYPRCYVPTIASAQRWAQYCRCDFTPEIGEDRLGGRCTMTWRDEAEDTWVVLHILDGWTHAWPGTAVTGQLPPDHPLCMFEASQVIWDFFCSYGRQRSGSE